MARVEKKYGLDPLTSSAKAAFWPVCFEERVRPHLPKVDFRKILFSDGLCQRGLAHSVRLRRALTARPRDACADGMTSRLGEPPRLDVVVGPPRLRLFQSAIEYLRCVLHERHVEFIGSQDCVGRLRVYLFGCGRGCLVELRFVDVHGDAKLLSSLLQQPDALFHAARQAKPVHFVEMPLRNVEHFLSRFVEIFPLEAPKPGQHLGLPIRRPSAKCLAPSIVHEAKITGKNHAPREAAAVLVGGRRAGGASVLQNPCILRQSSFRRILQHGEQADHATGYPRVQEGSLQHHPILEGRILPEGLAAPLPALRDAFGFRTRRQVEPRRLRRGAATHAIVTGAAMRNDVYRVRQLISARSWYAEERHPGVSWDVEALVGTSDQPPRAHAHGEFVGAQNAVREVPSVEEGAVFHVRRYSAGA
eukprot:scaffold94_cov254-Pinguiococcus_pyrenoidosus.AAC.2